MSMGGPGDLPGYGTHGHLKSTQWCGSNELVGRPASGFIRIVFDVRH